MRKMYTSLKSYERIIIVIIFSLIVIYLALQFEMREMKDLNASFSCELVKEGDLSCNYNCYVFLECPSDIGDLNSNLVILHSEWTAIYNELIKSSCKEKIKFEVEIPKRNHNYLSLISLYNEKYMKNLAYRLRC